MQTRSRSGGLDAFRMIAALLVIAIHTSPLTSINDNADFFFTRILARVAVPFFFMVTGQFVVSEFLDKSGNAGNSLLASLRKIGLIYGVAILLYIPIGIYAGHYKNLSFYDAIEMLVFDGTFYHLWYFPACMVGLLLVYGLSRFLSLRSMTVIAAVLYVFGLLGDSYYGIIEDTLLLGSIYDGAFEIFSYTRNGLFYAPIFLILGVWMKQWNEKAYNMKEKAYSRNAVSVGLAVSCTLMTVEGFVLHVNGLQRHDSMYIALIPTMLFLYQLLLHWNLPRRRAFRTISTWIYVLHPAVIVGVRMIAKPLHLNAVLVENSVVHYLVVVVISVVAAGIVTTEVVTIGKKYRTYRTHRTL